MEYQSGLLGTFIETITTFSHPVATPSSFQAIKIFLWMVSPRYALAAFFGAPNPTTYLNFTLIVITSIS